MPLLQRQAALLRVQAPQAVPRFLVPAVQQRFPLPRAAERTPRRVPPPAEAPPPRQQVLVLPAQGPLLPPLRVLAVALAPPDSTQQLQQRVQPLPRPERRVHRLAPEFWIINVFNVRGY